MTDRPDAKYHAFRTEERTRLTPQQRAKLFLDRGGKCHKCGRKLRAGDKWIDEHIQALENGGTNDWSNRGITCSWCFPVKNREDDAIAAKTRHVAVKHYVPTDLAREYPPMPGSKASPYKKTFRRGMIRRDEE